jgi:hypothetical protein
MSPSTELPTPRWEALRPDRQEGADHRQEAQPVQEEGRSLAEPGDDDAGDGRPDDAGAVERGRVQGDRVGQVIPPDQLDDEGLARGHVDRVDGPEEEGENRDVPVLDVACPRERRQRERLERQCRLRGDDQPALG